MSFSLELSKSNRLRLARAFQHNKRVDYSIDCVIEGQMGKAFVDSPSNPTAFRITVGPFWYFAGDARSNGGRRMMEEFPAYSLLMPSPSEWLEVAQETFGESLHSFSRYSFSPDDLSIPHLESLLQDSPFQESLIPLDIHLATRLIDLPDSFFEPSDFESVEDFTERGMGYTLLDQDIFMGVIYSSLVCSRGIEVSLFVDEPYRRQGAATALASKLLLDCLAAHLRPNWDAANPESCKLALKLGYKFLESYEAYYYLS